MKNTKLKKLQVLLGLVPQSFGYKTTDGVEIEIEDDAMEMGKKVYVITPEGQLPIPDGEYEMEMGAKIKTMGGVIEKMETIAPEQEIVDVPADDSEIAMVPADEEMASATLVDGTKVEAEGDFEVGKPLFVITEAGEKVPAPEGEHTTDSGIVVVVDAEGIITGIRKPDMAPEGSLETEMSIDDVVETFTTALENLNKKVDEMNSKYADLESKFSKFSSAPAGEKIYDKKGFTAVTTPSYSSKADALMTLRKMNKN